jgi:hypothetical protein
MQLSEKEIGKKRIMFLKDEDYYYIVYNILILLLTLKCTTNEKRFVDAEKLAFLVDFVSDHRFTEFLLRDSNLNSKLSPYEKTLLINSYFKSLERKKIIVRILRVMEEKGYLQIMGHIAAEGIDIIVVEDKIPSVFKDAKVFNPEKLNINNVKKLFPRIRSSKMKVAIQKLFGNYGVEKWQG